MRTMVNHATVNRYPATKCKREYSCPARDWSAITAVNDAVKIGMTEPTSRIVGKLETLRSV